MNNRGIVNSGTITHNRVITDNKIQLITEKLVKTDQLLMITQ